MPDYLINGDQITVRDIAQGEDNPEGIREWCRDMSSFLEKCNFINRRMCAFFTRQVPGSGNVVVDINSAVELLHPASANLGDPNIALGTGTELYNVAPRIFWPILVKQTAADFGEGFSQFNYELDEENEISLTYNYLSRNVTLTNNTASAITAILIMAFFHQSFMPPHHVATIS